MPKRDMLFGDRPGPSGTVSSDHKTEMFLHRRKVTVVVQQQVAMLDAEGTDDDVGCFSDRDAKFSQLSVIPGSTRGQTGIQKRHESIPT